VKNKDWIDFIKNIRPSYSLPSRFVLANRLLEKEFNRVEAEVSLNITKSMAIGLQCDGWSNRRNESIINFIVSTPKPFFYKSLASNEEKHTGEYVAQQMEKILIEVGQDKFYGIVTDNATAMVKARDILHEKYPHIAIYSCAPHTLNLLVLDILKCKTASKIEFNC